MQGTLFNFYTLLVLSSTQNVKTCVYDSLSSKNSGWHLENSVNAPVIVVADVLVNCGHHLTRRLETMNVSELLLETTKEGFDMVVLPR